MEEYETTEAVMEDLIKELHQAVVDSDRDRCKQLLSQGVPASALNSQKESDLMVATRNAEIGICRLLIDAGAPVNLVDRDGRTVLHYAAEMGHEELCRMLLLAGAAPDLPDSRGRTALHFAVRSDLECCRALVEKGATVDASDWQGRTPLMYAIEVQHNHACVFLLKNHAAVNHVDKVLELTPLFEAAKQGSVGICKVLCKRGAMVDYECLATGETPLFLAAAGGHVDACRYLVERGADPLRVRADGASCLVVAAMCNSPQTVRFFLSKNVPINETTTAGVTALHLAAEAGLTDICRLLLDNAADVNQKGTLRQLSALHIAALNGHRPVCQTLLAYCAQINGTDAMQNSALHLAAKQGHAEVVKFLLERNASANMFNQNGDTPLMLAARKGHEAVCEILVAKGALINTPSRFDSSAVHEAAVSRSVSVMKLMVARGADVTIARKLDGLTPYQIAVAQHDTELIAYLQSLTESSLESEVGENAMREVQYAPMSPVMPALLPSFDTGVRRRRSSLAVVQYMEARSRTSSRSTFNQTLRMPFLDLPSAMEHFNVHDLEPNAKFVISSMGTPELGEVKKILGEVKKVASPDDLWTQKMKKRLSITLSPSHSESHLLVEAVTPRPEKRSVKMADLPQAPQTARFASEPSPRKATPRHRPPPVNVESPATASSPRVFFRGNESSPSTSSSMPPILPRQPEHAFTAIASPRLPPVGKRSGTDTMSNALVSSSTPLSVRTPRTLGGMSQGSGLPPLPPPVTPRTPRTSTMFPALSKAAYAQSSPTPTAPMISERSPRATMDGFVMRGRTQGRR